MKRINYYCIIIHEYTKNASSRFYLNRQDVEFYSDVILSKRGPLARIWIAAHIEKKLSKKEAINTDIGESVDVILNPEAVEPMALRMSGQLLLGITRIHSRKAKYLLEDVNDALTSLRKAFIPGIGTIDLSEQQLLAPENAITLEEGPTIEDGGLDLEQFQAPISFSLDPLFDINNMNMSVSGISSGDFMGDLSIEAGRREGSVARSDRFSILGSEFNEQGRADKGRQSGATAGAVDDWGMPIDAGRDDFGDFGMDDVPPAGRQADNMEMDLGGAFDGGLDLGFNLDEPLVPAAPSIGRESSPLSSAPPADSQMDMDDSTRNAVEQEAQRQAKRGGGRKRHIVDSRIELGRRGASQSQQRAEEDISKILQDETYLQPSRAYQERLDILQDPLNHFINVNASCLRKQRDEDEDGPSKRLREDAETGRHESIPFDDDGWNLAGIDVGPADTSAWEGGDQNEDTFQLDDGQGVFDKDVMNEPLMNDEWASLPTGSVSGRSESRAPSRMSTPSLDTPSASQYEAKEGEAPIAMFGRKQTKQDAKQLTKDGYSRTTVKAKEFLKARLTDNQPESHVSFNEISNKANKRAASSFFFEMLVLGTRQQVNLNQESPFSDIKIGAKDKLLV
ncbi:hypothetical protein E3Q13_01195 [Wallemia mellicola]|nr:hypothetical protein E3Q13_01195 [Wallemia mellicola]